MVFSFGGGTNDTTLMDFGGGVFEVLSTSGDTKLGGTDLDTAVVEGQCPLALKAVPDPCAYAAATVVTDIIVMFIQ
jgi:molecular chaperone DnaK (HSP70)